MKAYPIISLLPCITLSRTCHAKHTMPSALTNEGCAFSKVNNISIHLYYHSQNEIQKKIEKAHINLFTCCLCKGINVDSAALFAFEEDQTCRRLYAITCDNLALADSHIGLIDIFDKENQGLFYSTPSDIPLQCMLFTDTAGGQSILKGELVRYQYVYLQAFPRRHREEDCRYI